MGTIKLYSIHSQLWGVVWLIPLVRDKVQLAILISRAMELPVLRAPEATVLKEREVAHRGGILMGLTVNQEWWLEDSHRGLHSSSRRQVVAKCLGLVAFSTCRTLKWRLFCMTRPLEKASRRLFPMTHPCQKRNWRNGVMSSGVSKISIF